MFPALKRGLGAARERAAGVLKDAFDVMSFRTRPAGAEPGLQPRGKRDDGMDERTERRAGDSNPDALARGGFQVLQSVLRLVACGSICPS